MLVSLQPVVCARTECLPERETMPQSIALTVPSREAAAMHLPYTTDAAAAAAAVAAAAAAADADAVAVAVAAPQSLFTSCILTGVTTGLGAAHV
jgi:creatinine amidohydrolase/Fe(II)-dependent formamide hydrolase-like protein